MNATLTEPIPNPLQRQTGFVEAATVHGLIEARRKHTGYALEAVSCFAICRVGRAVFVIEVAGGEFERGNEKLPYFRRIILEATERIRQQGGIRRAALRFFRTCRRGW